VTPKETKDIKRAVAITLFFSAVAAGVGISTAWLDYRERTDRPESPVCLGAEQTFEGVDAAKIVSDGAGNVWACAGDVKRDGIHCTRMTERPPAECAKWARGWAKRNANRVEAIP